MPPPNTGTGINGPLLLEEAFVRTPYELLRRSHRAAQRQVEKDYVAIQFQLANLLKSLTGNDEADRTLTETKLDAVEDRVHGLKRKLNDLQPSADSPSVLRERLKHIDEVLLASSSRAVAVPPPTPSEDEAETDKDKDADDVPAGTETEAEGDGAETVPNGEAMDVDQSDREKDKEAKKEKDRAEVLKRVEQQINFKRDTSGGAMLVRPAQDKTLDRYIVDHLLRTGRLNTAIKLAASQGIDDLVDIKLFTELLRIETALTEKQSCTEALAWCGENRGTLKKIGSNLEFSLRFQEMIELCRKRDTKAAIAYAQKNLSPWAGTHMTEVSQAMTLLAFGENTGVSLYRKLYDRQRWSEVRDQFRMTFLSIYGLPSQSLLALSLSAGLSSLRVPACISPDSGATEHSHPTAAAVSPTGVPIRPPPAPLLPPARDLNLFLGIESPELDMYSPGREVRLSSEETGTGASASVSTNPPIEVPEINVDCPTCAPDIRILAQEVPFAHHVNSTLVCRISGDVMDSENPPLAFPNGYVYSTKALTEMARNNFDVVTCPRTHETCAFARLRKVYVT